MFVRFCFLFTLFMCGLFSLESEAACCPQIRQRVLPVASGPSNLLMWERYQSQWTQHITPRYDFASVGGRAYYVHRPYQYYNPRYTYINNGGIHRFSYVK